MSDLIGWLDSQHWWSWVRVRVRVRIRIRVRVRVKGDVREC